MPEPTPAQLRARLRARVGRRDRLRAELEEVDGEIADLAIASKGSLPREEVAEIVGVTRMALHKLMAWRSGQQQSRH